MTVPTEAAYAELLWTGAETAFTPGFTAERIADVDVSYLDADGLPVPLSRAVHYNLSLDSAGNVTATPISLPAASGANPVTLVFERDTEAVQGTDFTNLQRFNATVHGVLFDRSFRILAELKSRVVRSVGPFFTTDDVVDFRPRRVMAADPVNDQDLATKVYVLTVTGILNLQNYVTQCAASAAAAAASALAALGYEISAEAARDKAQAWSDTAENTPVEAAEYSAYHWSRKAQAYAASVLSLFNNPDDGIAGDAESGPIDDGVA
ncbi:hypothetical protein ONR75_24020 [Rhodopseudomonas sp. P2A-2r]|uniref:hypothetical protein n=1 Tax=Rhodopseudomonas sp. P2A-2r TaxID=2991972 RepID=UPI0022342446|nr:hypothetical protein [Rhodopseudomonas sp. P2A-2r]UZE47906.1 hypothetical protein ONR75_24020 [Rhodopseudomonas sp. P2A-2r]